MNSSEFIEKYLNRKIITTDMYNDRWGNIIYSETSSKYVYLSHHQYDYINKHNSRRYNAEVDIYNKKFKNATNIIDEMFSSNNSNLIMFNMKHPSHIVRLACRYLINPNKVDMDDVHITNNNKMSLMIFYLCLPSVDLYVKAYYKLLLNKVLCIFK